jgi:hypothetical protein
MPRTKGKLAQRLGPVRERGGDPAQQSGPLGVGPPGPVRLGGAGHGNRAVHVGLGGQPGRGEDLSGRFVADAERAARRGPGEGPVDEHGLVPRLLDSSHETSPHLE